MLIAGDEAGSAHLQVQEPTKFAVGGKDRLVSQWATGGGKTRVWQNGRCPVIINYTFLCKFDELGGPEPHRRVY